MIYVDRSHAPEPAWLSSENCRRLKDEAAKFFTQPLRQREQTRFDFAIGRLRKGVESGLLQLFSNKCAYCETRLDEQTSSKAEASWNLEQYRPKLLGGDESAPDHYWWLCYSWDNLYPACATCNRNKRNLFPIAGERCSVGATGAALRQERPSLVEPCLDKPEDFLIINSEGLAIPHALSTPSTRGDESGLRGEVTISLLELNRKTLVRARRDASKRMEQLVRRCVEATQPNQIDARASEYWSECALHLAADAEFSAASRFACVRALVNLTSTAAEELARAFLPQVPELPAYFRILRRLENFRPGGETIAGAQQTRVHAGAKLAAPVEGSALPPGIRRAVVVSRVRLTNYRIIEKVEFELPQDVPPDLLKARTAKARVALSPESNGAPSVKASVESSSDAPRSRGWKMILGENGSGKSSVLHALALALMGREFYEARKDEYGLSGNLKKGAREPGEIEVWLSGDAEPIHLRLQYDGVEWVHAPDGANIFLRGYGASRLLPKRQPRQGGPASPTQPAAKNVDNLFDPFAPLIDAEAWLRSLTPEDFRQAAISLKDLLSIKKGEGDLGFEQTGQNGRFGLHWQKWNIAHFTPLEHFSAGYQTLLALACDIMAGVGKRVEDMIYAPGVILIDEIGTNLHPRWRMEVVKRLRKTFPAMQFIASTHEPLCLRGLGLGEAAVMRLEEMTAKLYENLPSPAGLRVDQLLTSEYFGLNTAIDPDIEEEFGIYYDLLEREGSLTPEEKALLKELGDELADKSVLGSSRRDRLILRVIDKFLVESAKNNMPYPEPTPDVVRQVGDILKSIGSLRGYAP